MRTKFIGAAGTGKTTVILSRLADLVRDPFEVSFSSLTNAARDAIIPRAASMFGLSPAELSKGGWWRTTHSTAMRCVETGGNTIFPGTEEFKRFVAAALGRTYGKVSEAEFAALELWAVARTAGKPLADVARLQYRVDHNAPAPSMVLKVAEAYERRKRVEGVYDVVDPMMLFAGVRQTPRGAPEERLPQGAPPDGIRVLVLDECQDASNLIYRVQKRIEDEARPEHVLLAADPFQALFSFIGGDPSYFLNWEVDETVVMEKSWRCPAAVFELGQRCLAGCSNYRDFGIHPADHPGSVVFKPAGLRGGLRHALEACGDGTTMILARTNYIAEKLAESLEVPYRWIGANDDTRGEDFMTLDALTNGRVIPAERFARAARLIRAKPYFVHGKKAAWERGEVTLDAVVPGALQAAGLTEEGARFIESGAWRSEIPGAGRWAKTAEAHGAEAATYPKVSVGTIHSSKGLEADNVIVSDELTEMTARAMRYNLPSRDEERRVSYVAVTRAKHTAVVLRNTCPRRATWLK